MTVATKSRQQSVGRETTAPAPGSALGRGIAVGRNGEEIRRIRQSGNDPYKVPDAIAAKYHEEGFALQWNVCSVLGMDGRDNPDMINQAKMFNAGWRPVPADRHPGVWLPADAKGDIVIRGLRLEECPLALVHEARLEEKREADEQVNGSRAQFGFAPTARGFEGAGTSNSPAVRQNTFVRTQMVHVDDAPKPKYEVSLDD
ncbi:MAG TPA: hypothetical protein VHE81_06600 [Lacipirellulaceae bacterium]|jgi:hypothetical protein|nr:hypothetical protein [Lacipirellulaceae bacterium]